MRHALPFCLIALSSPWAAASPAETATRHIASISKALTPISAPQPPLSFSSPTLVAQMPEQIYRSQLPPVWFVRIGAEAGKNGYAMWESSDSGALLEFAIDAPMRVSPEKGNVAENVPALQQFPVPGLKAKSVASGCVPTAGASLVGYWAKGGFPEWLGPALPDAGLRSLDSLREVACRLRNGMRMSEIPDTPGYTDDGLCLSGAFPEELARALERDARGHGIDARVEYARFTFQQLRMEIDAARPVLLSCMVRLPQKPHLSWGHEVVGVGWMELEGAEFVGVRDNFYPTTSPEAVRWIRKEAFESLICVHPRRGQPGGESAGGQAAGGQNRTP